MSGIATPPRLRIHVLLVAMGCALMLQPSGGRAQPAVGATSPPAPTPAPVGAPAAAAPAPASAPGPPANLDFETGEAGTTPPGWKMSTGGCAAVLTVEAPEQGKQCAKLSGTALLDPSGGGTFCNLLQRVDATPYRSKRIRFRAAVRVEGTPPAHAQLWLREDRPAKRIGLFDNMRDRPIGPGGWKSYDIAGNVGSDAVTLNFGLMTFAGATVWIDDVSLEILGDVDVGPIEAPRPLTKRGAANLVAFARLLGYVRYFHPSDEAAATQWDEFAIDGVRAVEAAATPQELAAVLGRTFGPIAPTVQVFALDRRPKRAAPAARPTPQTGGLQVTMWQHRGVATGNPRSVYKSERLKAAVEGAALPAEFADPAQPFFADLGGGVGCLVPLAVFADDAGTLPHGAPRPDAQVAAHTMHTGLDRATRLADVALAWNVFQHFYPYFDVVKTDWAAALPAALQRAATDVDDRAFLGTLRLLVAALHDGHGRVSNPSETAFVMPPIQWQWVDEKLVVTQVPESLQALTPDLRPGAVVRSIDGRPVDAAWRDAAARISSATPQWARFRALQELARGERGSLLKVEVANGGKATTVELVRDTAPRLLQEARPDKISAIRPGIWYVDVGRLADGDLTSAIDSLAAARGIVFDMRGYPGSAEAWKVLQHAAADTLRSARWLIPRVTEPDHAHMAFDESGWPVAPAAPHFQGKMAFLTDGRAISAAETFMGIVEAFRLGEIVGGPTAGTNGNVNPFTLPGEYSISWTGMKVLKHDGSQHHGVGIHPTIPVAPTIAGIVAGRDEVLEKGVEAVSR